MIKWDDAQIIMKKLANDETAEGLTYLKLMANNGYKQVLSEFDSEQIEEERTTSTVANQRSYQAPVDALWVSNLTIVNGTTKYPLTEVKSRDTWERMTSNNITGIPDFYFLQPRKGLGGAKIQLEPIPNAVYSLIMVFETTAKDLGNDAHSTGTASVSQDSATVTGVGTGWTANMKGRYIRFTGSNGDGLWYKIAQSVPSTTITLENYYQGVSVSGESYEVAELFELPENLHMAPVYFSLWHYFAFKRDKVQAGIYENLYKGMVKAAHEAHATKSRDSVVHGYEIDEMLSDYPDWFPADGVM